MQPRKNGAWNQGIYEISATPKEMVGTIREDRWGKKFAYARAGGTALVPSKQTIATAEDADWINEIAPATAIPIGATDLTLAITDPGTTGVNDENFFQGGLFTVQDGTGEAHAYTIIYSSAVASGSTAINIKLDEPIRVALGTTSASEFSLIHSPYMNTLIATTSKAAVPTGVPLVDVTADYYYWSQIGGIGISLGDATTAAIGLTLSFSTATAGATAVAMTAGAIVLNSPAIAVQMETGVSGEYSAVRYCID